jgi:tetratricopeptide (TPR) repeat protein
MSTETTPKTPTLNDWINTGWNDHADDAEGVMSRFGEALELVSEPGHLPQVASLIVHVSGDHLGRYQDGLQLLDRLSELSVFDASESAGQAILRCQAILQLCAGNVEASGGLEERAHGASDLPNASTSIRVQVVAAGALAQQGKLDRAIALFQSAVDLADYGPDKADPASRSLAITANNLACDLEQRDGRTPEEDRLLELAAKTARTFWEIAGTWVQVKIAEYRLAMTYIALGNPQQATAHANQSLALVEANDGSESDRFFPYEALAQARHADGDAEGAAAARAKAADALASVEDEGTREWFSSALAALDKTLG